MSTEESKAVIDHHMSAPLAGDIEEVTEDYTDESVFIVNLGGVFIGKDAIRRSLPVQASCLATSRSRPTLRARRITSRGVPTASRLAATRWRSVTARSCCRPSRSCSPRSVAPADGRANRTLRNERAAKRHPWLPKAPRPVVEPASASDLHFARIDMTEPQNEVSAGQPLEGVALTDEGASIAEGLTAGGDRAWPEGQA